MTALKRMRILSLALTLTMLFTVIMAFPSSVSAADWDYPESFSLAYSYGTFAGASVTAKSGITLKGTATTQFSKAANNLTAKAEMGYYRRNTITGALEQGGNTATTVVNQRTVASAIATDQHSFACDKMWSKGTHIYVYGSYSKTDYTYQSKTI